MSPETIFSRMKWRSISMCLVLLWKTGLELIWSVVWLSHICVIWVTSPNCNSLNNCLSQTSSKVVEAIVLYYAFALDLATTLCFLLFQEIKLSPMETQYAKVELYQKEILANQHLNNKQLLYGLLKPYNKHFPGDPLVYFNIWMIAFQWSWHGELRNWLTTLTAKEMLG